MSEEKMPLEAPTNIIKVGADEIKRGKRNTATKCMVALAISEQIANCLYTSVRDGAIMFSIKNKDGTGGMRYVYKAPKTVAYYISQFDQGKPIQPFSFSLQKSLLIETRPMFQTTDEVRKKMRRRRLSKGKGTKYVFTRQYGNQAKLPG